MYKDVWKKFGWKMLIAVCSVLLLGGVAFAAPRLRAEGIEWPEEKIDLRKYDVVADRNEYTYSLDIEKARTAEEGNLGEEKIPDRVNIVSGGVIVYKNVPVEDNFHIIKKENGNVSEVGEASVVLTGKSEHFTTDDVEVTYRIIRQTDPPIEVTIKGEEGHSFLVLNGESVVLKPENLIVYYCNGDEKIKLPQSEYELLPDVTFKDKGSKNINIRFKNYAFKDGGGEDHSVYTNAKCSVKKDVHMLDVRLDGKPYDPKAEGNYEQEPSVTVFDDGVDVTASMAVCEARNGTITVKADENGYYYNTVTYPYTYNAKEWNLQLLDEDRTQQYKETGDGKGYIFIPEYLRDTKNDVELKRNEEYKVLENSFKVQGGGTAGVVSFTVQGMKEYFGREKVLTYRVYRDISNAIIEADPEFAAADYTYNGEPQTPALQIYFPDDPDYKISLGDDITNCSATYVNVPISSDQRAETTDTPVNAGTVTVTVTGNGSAESGGYCGTRTLSPSYTIKRQMVNGDQYHLKIKEQMQGGAKYMYTGNPIDVTPDTIITKDVEGASREVVITGLVKDEDYYVEYFDSENKWLRNGAIEKGTYTVRYTFIKNYEGYIEGTFEIYTYPLENCIITIGSCDGEKNGHVYNGKAHEPKVSVRYKGDGQSEVLDASMYTVTYGENIDACTEDEKKAWVTVTIAGESQTEYFAIDPMDISKLIIKPVSGYKEPDDGLDYYTHDYVGKTQYPGLSSVFISSEDDFGSIANVNIDYSISGLYVGSSQVVEGSNLYPSASREYKYRIVGRGNYTGTAYTEKFKLRPKDIGDSNVDYDIPYGDSSSYSEEYVEKNLKIRDDEFGDTLEFGTDFTFKIEDKRETGEGIWVTVTGKECYEGEKIVTYYAGIDIATATVYNEDGTAVSRRADGKLWFNKSYTGNDDGSYNIAFRKIGTGSYTVYLRVDGDKILYVEKDYMVSWNPPDFSEDDSEKMCSVTLKGKGQTYYGQITVFFNVSRPELNDKDFHVNITSGGAYVYEGRQIRPDVVSVTDSEGKALLESDYTVSWGENVNAGTGQIFVTGKRNYSGKIVKEFPIEPRDLETAYAEGYVRLTGLNEKKVYKYVKKSEGAVKPGFEVEFNPDGFATENDEDTKHLIYNTDYTVVYQNNEHVWQEGDGEDSQPTIQITAKSKNFKNAITETFEIRPVNLETECTVKITPSNGSYFTGREIRPDISVWYVDDNGAEKRVDESEYTSKYENNVLVSELNVNNQATIIITAKEGGNYEGERHEPFVIKGDLSKVTAAGENCRTDITVQPIYYPGSGNDSFVEKIMFHEKDSTNPLAPPNEWSVDRELIEGTDYTTDTTAKELIVGPQTGVVKGSNYFGGSQTVSFNVVGSLASDYTSYNKDLGVITSVASESAIDYLVKKISPVKCGGRTLTYGVDYKFNKEPDMTLGFNKTIEIIPYDGVEYLTESAEVTYTVKQGFDETGYEVEGVDGPIEYNHGHPVITAGRIKVYPKGSPDKPLREGTDYVIDTEASQLTDVGQGYLVIRSAENSSFVGTITKNFDIIPYDLQTHYAGGDLDVTYHNPEYTGNQITADALEIVITAKPDEYIIDPKEYSIEVSGADIVNRTADDAEPLTFKILASGKNYTGTIESPDKLQFKILPKPLTEDMFKLPKEVEYHEKDTAPPAPEGTYNNVAMKGILYQTDITDYKGYDFSYTYVPTDTKTGGQKTVRITGHGNFDGEIALYYTVTKKDISSSDIVLTLTTPEPYIYNDHEQTPAFELTYEGETILVYDGKKASVTRLLNPTVEYSHNKNAGTGIIQIEAQENDPNYTGQKDYTFTIEPLPIDNHISFLWGSEGKNLASFKLELPRDGQEWAADGGSYIPKHLASKEETGALPEDNNSYVRVYYNDSAIKDLELYGVNKADYNADAPVDYTIDRYYVEPDTDDTRIREEYDNQDFINAGKVKVTITGTGNYTGTACYWYYIGTDISAEGASSLQKTTTVFNAQQQWPVEVVSGLDASKYRIVRYRHAVTEENILGEKPVKDKDGGDTKAFIDADTYYIRIEGKPEAGTYSSKPIQLTYTILPRSINRVLIDGYKAEYQYTGSAVCPAGLTVTDPIDEIRYKLTENKDYTISYSNNINAGVASIIIKGQGNYDSGTTATARFTITSSTISSGSSGGNGGGNSAGSSDGSSGQLAGPSSAISADDVRLTMDTSDAMYYTGSAVYPGVYISGMTENIDYTVTFSNNINVGQGIVTIRGINNSSGVITKTFRIIGDLAKCSVAAIPDQAYTGLAVTPGVTVTCGTNTLLQGTDYTLSYANNINIGTASVVITAARDSNYVGSVTVNFSIGNGISSAVVSGYASHYTYTGEPITPAVSVAAGSATLRAGTDYTVEYADNTNAGTATMTITGKGVYSGTQKVTFVIEPKSIASCTTTDVSGKKYTGDAYTPAVTVSDGGKTLTNGVDYTVTYANNTNPGVASIIIRALNDNYTGTKTINFRIGTVAVSNFHAGNIKSTSMTLAWTAQDYASGYQICDANSRVVKNSTKNKVTLTGLTSGKTYKYKVRSFIRRADGTRAYGSFSTVISATTKLKTPTVKAASTGKNKARIRWSKVTGATGYQIYYSKSATKGFKKLKTTKNTVRTLNIKGLSSGQRYFFRVRAYKRVGSKNIYSNYNSLKAITVK